jgi:Flp pilus assembly protein TadD
LFRSAALPGSVALITAICFAGVLWCGFTNWDDNVNVTLNPYLNPPGLAGVLHLWSHPYRHLYIPLVYTTYAAEMALGGGAPWVFHAGNLLLHAASSILVFLLVRMILLRARQNAPEGLAGLAAACGAMLFSLHPVQVEAVAWITGRKDVLSGFLSLLAVWLFLRESARSPVPQAAGVLRLMRDLPALAVFVCALLAKPSAVAVPLLLLAVEWGVDRHNWRAWLVRLLPWFVFASLAVVLTSGAQPLPEELVAATPVFKRPFLAADALLFYAGKTLFPAGLSPVYGRTPVDVIVTPGLAAAAVSTLLVVGGLLWRGGVPGAAAGIFVAGVLPVLGFSPFLFQAYSTVADRYLYLSIAGAGLAAAWGVLLALERWRSTGAVLAVPVTILLVLGVLSAFQVRVWRDSLSLWSHAVRHAPRVAEVRNNLGNALLEAGRPGEATEEFRAAVEINPRHPEANNNLGNQLLELGDAAGAVAHFRRAIERRPGYAQAHNNLGNAYHAMNSHGDAVAMYREAVRLDPGRPEYHSNLAIGLLAAGEVDAADRETAEALARFPRDARARVVRGLALERKENRAGAAEAYRAALALEPGNREAARRLGAME